MYFPQIFNLGNGKPCILKDFIALVEKYVKKKVVIDILPAQPGDVDRTAADISHARKLLGYNPSISLEEGIKKTVEWYLEHMKHQRRHAVRQAAPHGKPGNND
jgi:UDP-glucuronate 4-epimerase